MKPSLETPISSKSLAFMKAHVIAGDCGVSPERLANASDRVKKGTVLTYPFRGMPKSAVKELTIPEIIDRLQNGYRVFISAQRRSQSAKQQARFVVRGHLGYHHRPEGVNDICWSAMRAEIAEHADGLIQYLIEGKDPTLLTGADKVVACQVAELVILNFTVWTYADTLLTAKEEAFKLLVAELPIWAYAKTLPAFNTKEFARLVGVAGDLSNYPSVNALWKRLGLAVLDGRRQHRERSKEGAAAQGYSPKRRRQAWIIVNKMFIKDSSWKGDDGKTKEAGEWRLCYDKKKAVYLERGWLPQHAHKAAVRYMGKCILKALYKKWIDVMPKKVGDADWPSFAA